MKYYPLSEITKHPGLGQNHVWELLCAYHVGQLSMDTMAACNQVAAYAVPYETPLFTIASENAPMRLAYTELPTLHAFTALERAGFMVADGMFRFMVDALH
jgi:hypothetical protein